MSDNIEALKKELAAAKAEATEARKEAEAARAAAKSGGVAAPVKGEYKGYQFDVNHRHIYNSRGLKVETQKLLDAAKGNDPEACAELDRLIALKYAHFTKK